RGRGEASGARRLRSGATKPFRPRRERFIRATEPKPRPRRLAPTSRYRQPGLFSVPLRLEERLAVARPCEIEVGGRPVLVRIAADGDGVRRQERVYRGARYVGPVLENGAVDVAQVGRVVVVAGVVIDRVALVVLGRF